MSAQVLTTQQAADDSAAGFRRALLLIVAGLAMVSGVRVLTGADDLTSVGAISAGLGLAVPIGMAALGGLWSERAGVVNIGLEGMMILGTWGAGWAGYQWGPWAGLGFAIVMGALGGLLHAVATVTFAVDHIISGTAINILGLGVTQFLSAVAFTGVAGGGPTQSPPIVPTMGTITIPGVSSLMADIQAKGWFLISDVAGIIGGLTTNVSYITVIAVALFVITGYVLWRTPFGLRVRACGENPWSAESLGVKVRTYKYTAVIISGALAGIGGAYLAIVQAGIYREGQTGGRGFIGLAAMIFGNWRPAGTAAGAGLFGYVDAVQLRQSETVKALILVGAIALLALAFLFIARGRRTGGLAVGLIGTALLGTYLSADTIPQQIAFIAPYVTTLLVLALASQSLRMPAADGVRYRPGEE
jgi:general nucleoside transport system permease protein